MSIGQRNSSGQGDALVDIPGASVNEEKEEGETAEDNTDEGLTGSPA